ncbi:COG2847 Copper(I)-binding protein [Candidatus Nanopelagicaceae bacterium]
MKKVLLSILAATLLVPALTSCGSSEEAAAAITITEPVARAIDAMSPANKETGKFMTGSFMTISNSSDEDVTLTGGSSESAGIIEIHEVIDGAMVPMSGGLVIPAKGNVKLRMGGYHVMLMELAEKLAPGDEVTVTLEFSNGETVDYTAPVKEIAMDDEVYGVEGGM